MGELLNLDLLLTARAEGMEAFDEANSKLGGLATAGLAVGGVLAGAMLSGLVASTQKAAAFQQSLTGLVTGAGEAKSNIDLVSQGLLNMASQTGTSANQLAQGMYMVESAGYHGAQGLTVLKAAAEGAKVGNADMATVANAVTSALNAYHEPASSAVDITNELVATVASGKMHMQDLASALGNILPTASAAGISLSQVGGAIATMTGQGMDASRAATDLQGLLMSLQAPTSTQTAEMQELGLSANDLSTQMGQKGLTGTMQEMMDALQSKMGPAGQVVVQTLKAASGSTTSLSQATSGLTTTQQTYVGALSNMVGGIRGLQAALELTGGNMTTFQKNAASIADAAKKGGQNVEGWSQVQGDFNFKMEQLGAGIDAAGIKLGQSFLPIVTQVAGAIGGLMPDLNSVIGAIGSWADTLVSAAQKAIGGLQKTLGTAMQAFAAGSVSGGTAGGVTSFLEVLGLGPQQSAQVGSAIASVLTLVQQMVTGFQQAWPSIVQGAQTLGTVLGDLITNVGPPLLGLVGGIVNVATTILGFTGMAPVIAGIAAAVLAWNIVQTALNIQMAISAALTSTEGLASFLVDVVALTVSYGPLNAAVFVFNTLMAVNPVVLIVIGIAVLIAIIVLLITHWSLVTKVTGEVWDKMKQFGAWVGGELGKAFSDLGSMVIKAVTGILDWVRDHWVVLAVILLGPMGLVIAVIITHWALIKAIFTDAFLVVKAIVQTGWMLFTVLTHDALMAILGFVEDHFGQQIADVGRFFSAAGALFHNGWVAITSTVTTIAAAIESWVSAWLDRIRAFFVSHFAYVKTLVVDAWTAFWTLITTWATDIEQWILAWIQRELQGWRNLFETAKQLVTQGWTDLKNLFEGPASDIETFIGGWRDRVVKVIEDLASKIGSIAGTIASNLKSGFSSGVKDIQGVFDGLFSAISKLPGMGSVASTWKSDIDQIQGLAGGGALHGLGAAAMLAPFSRVNEGFVTNGPRAIVGEGNPRFPEYVIPSDPNHRANAARLWHESGRHMGLLESGGVMGSTIQMLDAGGLVAGSGSGAAVGQFGGQCEVWVESVENMHFPTATAAGMVSFVNSHTPTPGEIFVSTMPPDGHTGIVVGPNTVEDSNWDLDGMVRVHALSDIPDIAGYINLSKGLPAGVSASSAGGSGGGIGGLLSTLLQGPEKAANSAMAALGGWEGAFGVGVLQQLEGVLGQSSSSGGSSTGAAGTPAQVLSWINSAEGITGVGAGWTNGLSIIIDHESGGNPGAANNTDVNAAAGNASVGLMQLTASNRAAYTPPGMNPMDPVAEIVAGIRYIQRAYGSITNVPGVKSVLAGGPYLAYDNGGFLQPGVSQVFNGTGQPEPVLTGGQWNALSGSESTPAQQAQIVNALNEMASSEQAQLNADQTSNQLLQAIAGYLQMIANQGNSSSSGALLAARQTP